MEGVRTARTRYSWHPNRPERRSLNNPVRQGRILWDSMRIPKCTEGGAVGTEGFERSQDPAQRNVQSVWASKWKPKDMRG